MWEERNSTGDREGGGKTQTLSYARPYVALRMYESGTCSTRANAFDSSVPTRSCNSHVGCVYYTRLTCVCRACTSCVWYTLSGKDKAYTVVTGVPSSTVPTTKIVPRDEQQKKL